MLPGMSEPRRAEDLPPLRLKSAGPTETHTFVVQPRALVHGGKKRSKESTLVRALKSLDDAPDTRSTPADAPAEDHGRSQYHPTAPDYDPHYLVRLANQSNVLGPLITAMAENVAGHGHRLELRKEMTPELREQYAPEIESERLRLTELLEHVHYDHSLERIRELFRRRLEKVGYAGLEVITDTEGVPAILEPLHSQYLRKCPEDPEVVLWEQPVYDRTTLDWTPRTLGRRFRRWTYDRYRGLNGNRVYLREFGDPRVLDSESGRFYPADQPIDPETGRIVVDGKLAGRPANEVITYGLDDDSGPYPLPRYIGCLAEITMSWYAGQTNIARMENPIPPMLVLVSGGTLMDVSEETLREHFEACADLANVGAPLVLQAEATVPMSAAAGIGGTSTVKIEVVPLDRVMQDDGLFQTMDANNRKKVRACFKLSPMATGESDDFSRAAAQSGLTHDEDHVYEPARRKEDSALFDKALLPRWGIRFWRVCANPAPAAGDEALPDLLREGRESRALSSDDERQILARRLRIDLPPRDAKWSDVPAPFIAEGYLSTEALDEAADEPRVDPAAAAPAEPEPDGTDAGGDGTGADDEGEQIEAAKSAARTLAATLSRLTDGVVPRHDG